MAADPSRHPPAGDAASLVKKALAEIRELRGKLDTLERRERGRTEPIAIVGLGCRFPGAADPDAFWSLLSEGREGVVDVPRDRWDIDTFYDPDPDAPGKMYTRRGGFLEGIDRFDARFFGITPREAAGMDPQQRLLLEVAWEALEHAAIPPASLIGASVGVFVGLSASDYLQLQLRSLGVDRIDAYLASGGSPAVASGRLSYLLGLQGPSVTIDTACSSSLVAVHLACQSLRNQECRMALAGGVSLILLPELNVNFSRARMMAADGRCKTFDAAADGYVRSEGCGVVVLKPLSAAIEDGDTVLALLRGSAVNQDGRSSGLTVPNGPAQETVIRAALQRAGVSPADVGYVEAHGTGTALGDPIEVQALASVLGEGRDADHPFLLGSVKTNIGHLEAAAGLAGLVKVVLALQHEEIPPHLHLRTPNPLIPWDSTPARIPTQPTRWPAGTGRIAGISSFGFSGTNAHLIVSEAPAAAVEAPPLPPRAYQVLPLSARDAEALRELASRVNRWLEAHPTVSLEDACHVAATGRSHFSHRLAVVASDRIQVRESLSEFVAGRQPGSVRTNVATAPPGVAFMFTGQGAQYQGMARLLDATEPVFHAALDRCAAILDGHLEHPLRELLFGQAAAAIDETVNTQPALFAVEYALVELWRSWGVSPAMVMGHSLGEDVAGCVAGVMSLEEALPLVALRGRLMQALPPDGEMVAVFAGEPRVAEALVHGQGRVSIAALNGPENVTLSGERGAVRAVVAELERRQIRVRRVPASHAFHSPLIDPMLDDYERAVARVRLRAPVMPFVSTLTGRVAAAGELQDPSYWRRHVREPVRFGAAVETLWQQGCRVFVEIGPNPVLTGMAQRAIDGPAIWLPSLRQGTHDVRQMVESLAGAYSAGVDVDWAAFDRGRARRRVTGWPTYPFQREHFWFSPGGSDLPSADVPDVNVRWTRVLGAAGRQAAQLPVDLDLPSYPAKWNELDDLALAYVRHALVRLGLFQAAGERQTAEEVAVRLGFTPVGQGLLGRWFGALARHGFLRPEGTAYVSDAPMPDCDPDAMAERAAPLFADFPAPLHYVRRSGARLVDLLRGSESPLEVLFPDGTTEIADGLYSTSPLARYTNGIAHAAVSAAALDATPARPLRVLEIGGGTGGTTAGLLPMLPPAATAYCFTDVGATFLGRARDRFGDFPFVSYRTLDIERHPGTQGFAPHEFDVVVAANVLHATRNLHETLEHVAWLLAPSGLLVLCEATTHPFWFDMTTGFIGGWRRFEDDLRRDEPLLAPAAWKAAVTRHGFEQMHQYPEEGSPAEVLRQHVLVIRAAASVSVEVAERPSVAAGIGTVDATRPVDAPSLLDDLAELPEMERSERLVSIVLDVLARVMRLDSGRLPGRAQRLMDLGIDSLMAVEFRNALTTALRLERKLPATLIFDHPTAEAIARYLDQEVSRKVQAGVDAGPAAPATAIGVAGLEGMSDEEVEALLNKRLESL